LTNSTAVAHWANTRKLGQSNWKADSTALFIKTIIIDAAT